MKVDLNKNYKPLFGTPINQNMGEHLANKFASSSSPEPAKYMHWAMLLMDKKSLEINDDDAKEIILFINENAEIANFAKEQLKEEFTKK